MCDVCLHVRVHVRVCVRVCVCVRVRVCLSVRACYVLYLPNAQLPCLMLYVKKCK